MTAPDHVERWGLWEVELSGPADGNPFTEIEVSATFWYRNRRVVVDGFYDGRSSDGDGRYKIRFSPDELGRWRYRTTSSDPRLDGHTGEFVATAPGPDNHGPVRVAGTSRFAYADGTRHESYGTTCYHWTHTGDPDHEQRTLDSLAASPFNKVRMCILPTNTMTPPRLAFVGDTPGELDLTRFDPVFFTHFEQRVADLQRLGIEADLILFHPYDRGHWGVDNMTPEQDRHFLRYVVARLGAYRNVWWSMSNEFDFNKAKTMADWDALLQYLQRIDPYRRLASIHNGTKMYEQGDLYDFAKPWVTHQSIQHWDARLAGQWRAAHPRPVVLDELGYEGNIERRWGNLTGREMARRFWEGTVEGGFVGHGECWVEPERSRWISIGGTLCGESPARIAFLRSIISEGPADWLDRTDLGDQLIYFGSRRPAHHDLDLDDHDHHIEVIDTWQMTVHPLPGPWRGRCRVPLDGRTDLAIRVRRAA